MLSSADRTGKEPRCQLESVPGHVKIPLPVDGMEPERHRPLAPARAGKICCAGGEGPGGAGWERIPSFAVDSEREYQEYIVDPAISSVDPSQDHRTIPGELVLMKVYLDLAMQAWVNPRNDQAALNNVRKIAGTSARSTYE